MTDEQTDEQTDGGPEVGDTADDGARFGAALDELQRLVAELESDRLDVDHLTQRVQRATELVLWCRERLDATRFQVEELLVRLDDLGDSDGLGEPDEPDETDGPDPLDT